MAAIVTDRWGKRWSLERGDPGWPLVTKAIRQGLPLDYQVVPLEALLGLPLRPYDGGEGLSADAAARYWETYEAMV